MKYKDFLNESDRYNPINKEDIINLIKQKCKRSWQQFTETGSTNIYRGVAKKYNYLELKKLDSVRVSLSSNYLVNALFHESSKDFNHFQSRYNSVFCTNQEDQAGAFGNTMMCFPLDNSWFSCLNNDFIYSEINELFQDLLQNTDNILDNTDLDYTLLKNMNELASLAGTPKFNSIKYRDILPEVIVNDANKWIKQNILKINKDLITEISVNSLIDWTKFTDLREYFQINKKNFKNYQTKDLFLKNYQEIWTEDQLYMIDNEVVKDLK
jgi:hypothetical protein